MFKLVKLLGIRAFRLIRVTVTTIRVTKPILVIIIVGRFIRIR